MQLTHAGCSADFRCSGKPSAALQAMKPGCECGAFWQLCVQLERPLRKSFSKHFLQNCLHASHLVCSSDRELSALSPQLKERLPVCPAERHRGEQRHEDWCFPNEARPHTHRSRAGCAWDTEGSGTGLSSERVSRSALGSPRGGEADHQGAAFEVCKP